MSSSTTTVPTTSQEASPHNDKHDHASPTTAEQTASPTAIPSADKHETSPTSDSNHPTQPRPLESKLQNTDHATAASPAPQVAPSNIAIPPPAPSTTLVITAPPSPEHITVPPFIIPVLATNIVPAVKSVELVPTIVAVAGTPENKEITPHEKVQRVDTIVDLAARVTSPQPRRKSLHDVVIAKIASDNTLSPSRPAYGRAASSGDLRGNQATPIIPSGAVEVLVASVHMHQALHTPSQQHHDPLSLIVIHAGKDKQTFSVHRHLLVTKVPYFTDLFAARSTPDNEALTFEELDEFGFALFVRWLYGGALHGPRDFHTFQHYLSLYIVAWKFGNEVLQNEVMDLCRAYYHFNSMTAPAYRIEYIYTFTSAPNHMRNFLTTTAAYRLLCEAPSDPDNFLTDSMKGVIKKSNDFAVDFAEALIKLSKNGLVDVRKGPSCIFHVHSDGKTCDEGALEPYQNA